MSVLLFQCLLVPPPTAPISLPQSLSVQEAEGGHDAEADEDEEHLEQLPLGRVQLVRQDLQEGDVDERARCQALQHGLDERAGRQLSLHDSDAYGDAHGRHEGEDQHVGRHPHRRHGALDQFHRQAEHDDALVHQDGDADLEHLREHREDKGMN